MHWTRPTAESRRSQAVGAWVEVAALGPAVWFASLPVPVAPPATVVGVVGPVVVGAATGGVVGVVGPVVMVVVLCVVSTLVDAVVMATTTANKNASKAGRPLIFVV